MADTKEEQKPIIGTENDEKPADTDTQNANVENDEKPADTDTQNANVEEDEKEKNEKEEAEEDNDDDDGGESSEEELGSLEKPVEILSRKRDRKSTERFSLDKSNEAKKQPEDELDYTQGKGTELENIEFVKYSIDKTLSEDLKPLHRLLYHKIVKANMIKKNIRNFCGFPFEKDSMHYKRMHNTLDRFVLNGLRFIMGLLGLEKSGDKEQLKEKIITFLMEPKDLEKPIPKPKQKSNKSKDKKKSSKPQKNVKKTSSSEKVEDDGSSSDDSDIGEDKPREKKKKSESPTKKSTKEKRKSKPTPVKIAIPKKKKDSPKKKTPNKEAKRKIVDDPEDDEPLVKKSKSEPTDSELKKVIQDILKVADLEEVTMKVVCRQVYDRFPDFDVTGRKDFIKNTVKDIIS